MKSQSKDLSKRESEVVQLLLQGKSNKQIAMALEIAETTVEFHLKNIYVKLQVNSRAEAILKLGKSMSTIAESLGKAVVERESGIQHTSGTFISEKQETVPLMSSVSAIRKDVEMKNRWVLYFLTGLVFGALFLFYFEVIDRFMNAIHIDEENPFEVWRFISIEFLLIFGVWLIPTLYPARSEFRHSKRISSSVIAVVLMWVSAVLGYYLTYTLLLAFGLPGSVFWKDGAVLFPTLILFKFLQWAVIGAIVGGCAGLITSSLYSVWVRKTSVTLPA